MKITNDFIGNETKTLTKTKISTILRWWGFNPDSYSTWGNARSDMNNILSGTPTGEISDRERASTFLSKINYVNDTDAIIGDTIFAAGVPGVWYDPSDLSTLFQDTAGTIPVTGVEQPVGLMLDKSGRGNHASQATTTARPILRARYNLLNNTPWDGAVIGTAETCQPPTGWAKGFWTSGSIAAITDVNGDKALTFTATSGRIQFSQTLSVKENEVLVSKVDVLATSGMSAGAILDFTGSGTKQYFFNGSPIGGSALISQPGQLSCIFTAGVSTTSVSPRFGIGTNSSTSGTLTVCRPDFRRMVDVPNLPVYQRVISSSEYSTEGFPYYLLFDGVDDHLNIGVLNMSAASAAGYFGAITKLSDASSSRWYSHGLTTSTGGVRLLAPANAGQASVRAGFVSSSGLREVGGTAHAAPITLTVKSEIEPSVRMWITHNNGTQIQTTVDPTVFSADGEACIGAQVLASTRGNFFNGRIYALLVAGRKSSGSEQAVIETFLRNKSRAY